MPSWPVTLPAAPLADRYRETAPDNVLRTDMDAGPAKLRRRGTAGVGRMTLVYLLGRAQAEILDGFYAEDLFSGAAAFDFTHPRTGADVTCRFTAPPAYDSVNGDYFHATLEMEILP